VELCLLGEERPHPLVCKIKMANRGENGQAKVCVACDSSAIYKREVVEPKWRCQNCDHTFEKPNERPDKRRTSGGSEDSEDSGPDNVRLTKKFLVDRLENDGSLYVKSKEVARKTDLTTHQVGSAFRKLNNRGHVENWAKSSGVTWRITSDASALDPE